MTGVALAALEHIAATHPPRQRGFVVPGLSVHNAPFYGGMRGVNARPYGEIAPGVYVRQLSPATYLVVP